MKYGGGNKIEFASAGHEQVIKYSAKSGEVEIQQAGGIALAMVDDVAEKLSVESMKLEKNDVAILYTDGIPEAWKNSKEQYGAERLHKALGQFGKLKSADEIKKAIIF